MWWSTEWPSHWAFAGPAVMILLMALCIYMMMRMYRRHGTAGEPMACCLPSVGMSGARTRSEGGPRTGSLAFEEYRADTLRRLEHEQGEFQQFLERLRTAKDKAEFDQFMVERRNRPATQRSTP